MHKPQISCIYLDMDGVIANFEKRYTELYGKVDEKARRKQFAGNFDNFIQTNQFATLELMPGAMDLVNFLRKAPVPTQILSSTARESSYDVISKQKMVWLQTHGITFTPNFVPGKKHKYKWAKPNTIIIDDTLSVIDDWRKAGGIAIWHKDVPTTLAQLRLYV